jgi:hypothetical protein
MNIRMEGPWAFLQCWSHYHQSGSGITPVVQGIAVFVGFMFSLLGPMIQMGKGLI